jgi:hypothetical protein
MATRWASLWIKRPDALIHFQLPANRSGSGSDTDLRWTLYVNKPPLDDALLGHLTKRLNQVINSNLRYTFG